MKKMKTNISRRNFLKYCAAGAIGLTATGCSFLSQRGDEALRDSGRSLKDLGTRINEHAHDTNVSNELSGREFGDDYFNSRVSLTNINGKEYVWMPLTNYEVKVDERKLSADKVFPFAAFEKSKLLVKINPENKTTSYGYEDDTATVFVRDDSIKYISTGFKGELSHKTKPGQVVHTSEPEFSVPLINLGVDGFRDVAYVQDAKTGQLILAPSPEYGINSRLGGIVQYFPKHGVFVEQTGRISIKPVKPASKTKEKPTSPNPIEAKVEREN